jgi:hypothetical protein
MNDNPNEELIRQMDNLAHIGDTVSGFLKTLQKAGLSKSASEALLLKHMGVDVVFHAEGGHE